MKLKLRKNPKDYASELMLIQVTGIEIERNAMGNICEYKVAVKLR